MLIHEDRVARELVSKFALSRRVLVLAIWHADTCQWLESHSIISSAVRIDSKRVCEEVEAEGVVVLVAVIINR